MININYSKGQFFIAILLSLFVYCANGQIPTNGLSLWLKADKGLILSGNNLLSWKDQSNNRNYAVCKTFNYPQIIPHTLNKLPSVRFNGENNGLETGSFVSFPSKRGTIIIVHKVNGKSTTSGVGVGNLVSTYHGKGIVWQFCTSPTKYFYYDGIESEEFLRSNPSSNEWSIVTLMRSENTLMKLFEDGRHEQSFIINNNQPDTNTLKIGFNGRRGGTATDSIPEVLNGEIAEIIIYSRTLSNSELSTVHHYLSKKYALELTPPPFWERWWFYGLVILLIIAGGIIIKQFLNQRKLQSKLLELEKEQQIEKERQRISREMHDDIGAGLTQITLMSESAKNNSGGNELNDIAETSRKLVNSISEIIWSLNPQNKTLEQLTAYLREQLNKQLEYTKINYDILLPENGKDILISTEQRRNILLVTKEITNNSIKYSGAKNLLIEMQLSNNIIYFKIEDDGLGFDTGISYTGNGLKNVQHRIEELGGKIEIKSQKGKGSSFFYTVPL